MSKTYRHNKLFLFKEKVKSNEFSREDLEETWGNFHKREDRREFAKKQRKNSKLTLREQIKYLGEN